MNEKFIKSKVGITVDKMCCLILKALEKEPSKERKWGYSSAGRAPALQAGGQRFDPAYLHHRILKRYSDIGCK